MLNTIDDGEDEETKFENLDETFAGDKKQFNRILESIDKNDRPALVQIFDNS